MIILSRKLMRFKNVVYSNNRVFIFAPLQNPTKITAKEF